MKNIKYEGYDINLFDKMFILGDDRDLGYFSKSLNVEGQKVGEGEWELRWKSGSPGSSLERARELVGKLQAAISFVEEVLNK